MFLAVEKTLSEEADEAGMAKYLFSSSSTRSSTVLENSCVGVGKAKLKSNFASSNTLVA